MMVEQRQKGFLVLIGGAEDKKEDKLILRSAIALNKAENIAIIPTASEYPSTLADAYHVAFKDLGMESIHILDIRKRDDANASEYLDKIKKADLVFFTGGDQVKLVETLKETKLLEQIIYRYHNEGMTIAGTSAGAVVAANPMIYDGDYSTLTKGETGYSEGFGFLNDVTIDTHFVARGRLGRLTSFLCSGFSQRGIGLGEDTALIVSPDCTAKVIGSGLISLVNTEHLSFSNYADIKEDEKMVVTGVQVGFLQPGTIFDITKWEVVKTACGNDISTIAQMSYEMNEVLN